MIHPTTDLATASPGPVRSSFVRNRWLQLAAGVIGMVAVAITMLLSAFALATLVAFVRELRQTRSVV